MARPAGDQIHAARRAHFGAAGFDHDVIVELGGAQIFQAHFGNGISPYPRLDRGAQGKALGIDGGDEAAGGHAALAGLVPGHQQDQREQAQGVWKDILENSNLTPQAKQWSDSLFALGKLNFHLGKIAGKKPQAAGGTAQGEKSTAQPGPYFYFEESTRRLREYVNRYPESEKVHEARFLLARAL